MCIIQNSPKPTTVGVWWQDDTQWCRYPQHHDNLIRNAVRDRLSSIDLGVITSRVHPQGQRYTVNVERMEQVALSSGQRRPIMIIDPVTAAQPQQQISGPPNVAIDGGAFRSTGSLRVHYRDSNGQFKEYDRDVANALLQHALGQQRSVVLPVISTGQFMLFNFETMEQCFVDGFSAFGEPIISHKAPPVKFFVEVPWNLEKMMSLVRVAESTTRRKILGMTIERLRNEECLTLVLPERAYPRTFVGAEMEYQPRTGDPRFEDFVTALEENLLACPGGIESFLELTVPGSSRNSKVQIVFKPIDTERNEFLTQKKTKVTFWMSMAAPIAAAHAVVCGEAIMKITAYLAILPDVRGTRATRASVSCRRGPEVLIDRPDHYLSLVKLRVR